MSDKKPEAMDDYIAAAPEHAKPHLTELQALLREVAPNATETVKWGNPVFEERRILFGFAAFKGHMNFYATPAALEPFKQELSEHKTGAGSVQLPYDKPLPKELIRKIATYRHKDVLENDARWM